MQSVNRKLLYILGIIGLIGIIVFFFYFFAKPKGPVCGNNICEYFETPKECCRDCECWGLGEVCNLELNRCEKREINISDERIRELIIQYFENKGKEVVSMYITGLVTWENKLGKNVIVNIKNQNISTQVVVLEDEKIFEVAA
jgi:hypothetical protein